ncbi:MAG TPA: MarR family winged helix-turn-helix transcriptional regulator [Chloroflexota bacterium]
MRPENRPPVAFQLIFLGKHLDHLIEHRLAAHGLNRTQALTLMALKHHEGLNGMALCAHAGVEPANVSRTLQSLERLDLVERRPHPTDGRAQLFYLTARGLSMADDAGRAMREISAEILAGMDGKELECLEAGLQGLRRTILNGLGVERYHLSAIGNRSWVASDHAGPAIPASNALNGDNSDVERR